MSAPSDRWAEIAACFDELVELAPTARARRLVELANANPALAVEVQALLAADDSGNSLLDADASAAIPGLMADRNSAPGDGMVGPYRLLRSIGEGGMGEVWLGERIDGAYEQQVAIKLLKRGMDTHAILRRFLQERRILARLHHRHIVRLIDGGMSADARPYYVMDHVDGLPITAYAAQHRLGVRERTALLAKVAVAVAYAHTQLVVHRDLKPSNVLVDSAGEPRVLDFGIAKLLEASAEQTVTGTGMRVLSPAYAAPEQILGEAIGTATDVYALGLMLCELLIGQLPQQRRGATPAQLAHDVSHEIIERASTLAGRLGTERIVQLYGQGTDVHQLARALAGDLDLIIATALQREPVRRYATAAAFADDLQRWLDGRPIAARGDSASYRLRRFVRRHRVGVAATVLIALSLLGGLGVALYQADKAREQATLARQQAGRAERVKEFLVELFKQNDPAIAQGKELSAAEILRRGRAGLESSLADDPAMRGELLMTIAEIQGNLGHETDGLATAEQAFTLLQASLPSDDPLLAYAYTVRAELYALADRLPDAERDLRQASAILTPHANQYPERLDYAESELAYVLARTKSPDEGVAMQAGVVERIRTREGQSSSNLALQRLLLAVLLEDSGEYAQAEAQYRQALPSLTSAKGKLLPKVCEAERNFAGLLDRLGKSNEAIPHFDRALDCTAILYGSSSPAYARALFSRGILLLSLRRYVDAEADFRATLPVFAGPSKDAAHAHRYLGRALEEQRRYTDAGNEYAEAERQYRKVDVPHDVQRWRARADYGYALFKGGEIEKGRAAIDAALAGLRIEMPDGDGAEYMRPLRALGEVARAQGQIQAALEAHRRWYDLAVKKYGRQSRDAYQSAYQLSIDLAAQGDRASLIEARALILEASTIAQNDSEPALADYQRAQRDIVSAIERLPQNEAAIPTVAAITRPEHSGSQLRQRSATGLNPVDCWWRGPCFPLYSWIGQRGPFP